MGQSCGSRLQVNDLMCDWVFLGFPCFYQWWVIKHCSPPLSFRLIQKIFSQQTVTSRWKVEELNCDRMNFITASLLLQFLNKLVKDKNTLFIYPLQRCHHHGPDGQGWVFAFRIRVCLLHHEVPAHHNKCYVYCIYRKKQGNQRDNY